jgi:predicted small metal-binding protein
MTHRLAVALVAAVLSVGFAKASFAEDKPAAKAAAKPLKLVSCPSPCDFTVKSHDEKELVAIVKAHAKKKHKMDMTDKQIKDMIKTEPAS